MEFAVTADGQTAPATGGAATIPAAFLSTFADPAPAVLNITGQPASIARPFYGHVRHLVGSQPCLASAKRQFLACPPHEFVQDCSPRR